MTKTRASLAGLGEVRLAYFFDLLRARSEVEGGHNILSIGRSALRENEMNECPFAELLIDQ